MSSPAAGKFQDHYEVLGVDHKAGSDAIQAAYARLADKYNPKTGAVPDAEKSEAISLAFEVLSDPQLRGDFDKLKGIGQEDKPKFSGLQFFEAYRRDAHLRVGLLCVLYDRRRTKPFTPSLSMRHLEAIFSATTQELNFALWYLKQRDLVMADDKSSLQITVDGMDYLEANPASPELVLPMIKAAGLAEQAPEVASAPVAETDSAPTEAEPEPETSPNPEPLAEELLPAPALVPVPISAGEATMSAPEGPMSVAGSAARIGDLLARRKVS
jgi:curved DNA-binding protein CbpA